MEIRTFLNKNNLRRPLLVAAFLALFAVYTAGIARNPPGFYMDESATAYNAYLISRTGHGEFGPRLPLLVQWYSGPSVSYVNPVTIYLMALFFRFVPPSIVAARMFAAFWMFSACLLLGVLAKRISGRASIGIIVAGTALLTPWLFEESRLVWDAHFVPMAVMLFLLAAYRAQTREKWSWREILFLAGSLALLTYGYFAGRVLAPLFALGLLFFATTRSRLIGIIKVWGVYGLTLVPTLIFSWRHPGAVANRFELATYIKPGVPWRDAFAQFIRRYLEDQSVLGLLQTGHPLPRHHVVEAGGVFFFATFFLAMLGLLVVVIRHRREPWWRFTFYGLAVSIVPGAITYEPFHALRLLGLPVFLLLLTVPALEWLLSGEWPRDSIQNVAALSFVPWSVRFALLVVVLALTIFEAVRFQRIYRLHGPGRGAFFDAPYQEAFDAAVAQPQRPIYLRDGFYGPSYIDGLWYAAIEKRPRSEFVHLENGIKPPAGAIVLSSEQNCEQCEMIKRSGIYLLYRQK
ncbi:MAG TPA: hypothetical protein VNX27_06595 [Chthoniobacterales bacterium]|jgi:hypothetical protein|nr:hypothetical protein [Chthoniobacterales bacterium]